MKKRVWIGLSILIVVLILAILAWLVFYRHLGDSNYVQCGVQNCHGPIVCGETRSDMTCTAVFAPGDGCRQLASCETVQGKCQVVAQPGYDECAGCANQCGSPNGQDKNGSCYSWCSGLR